MVITLSPRQAGAAGHTSQSTSFLRPDWCCHSNSAHFKSTASCFPTSAGHYETSSPREGGILFGRRGPLLNWHLVFLFTSPLSIPKVGWCLFIKQARQWRQSARQGEHPSHLSGIITIQYGVKASPPSAHNNPLAYNTHMLFGGGCWKERRYSMPESFIPSPSFSISSYCHSCPENHCVCLLSQL